MKKRSSIIKRCSKKKREIKKFKILRDQQPKIDKDGNIVAEGTGEFLMRILTSGYLGMNITKVLFVDWVISFNFQGKNARELFSKYLDGKNLSQEDYNEALDGFDRGVYGTNIGDDAILFEDNIMRGITAGGFAAKMAAATALHETLHIQNKKAGIVNDESVVERAKTAVTEIENRIKELNDLGEISKEDYEAIKKE